MRFFFQFHQFHKKKKIAFYKVFILSFLFRFYFPHSNPIFCIPTWIPQIFTPIPCIRTLIPAFPPLFPAFPPRFPKLTSDSPIPRTPTKISRIPNITPRIHLIQFPNSPFQLLQITLGTKVLNKIAIIKRL